MIPDKYFFSRGISKISLHICGCVNGATNYCYNTNTIDFSKWIRIEIGQELNKGEYTYYIGSGLKRLNIMK